MIKSFRHKGLKRFFESGDRRGINPQHADKIEQVLAALDAAVVVDELDLPGFRSHPLTGNLKGLRSVTVRANWRIVFRFSDGDAFDVDLTDYH